MSLHFNISVHSVSVSISVTISVSDLKVRCCLLLLHSPRERYILNIRLLIWAQLQQKELFTCPLRYFPEWGSRSVTGSDFKSCQVQKWTHCVLCEDKLLWWWWCFGCFDIDNAANGKYKDCCRNGKWILQQKINGLDLEGFSIPLLFSPKWHFFVQPLKKRA